jgi:hypothetical protein
MLPVLLALGLDERSLRGVGLWVKPLKFMASVALFALTTAWCIGFIDEGRRRSRAVRGSVITIVVTSLAEVGYITLQAALGQGSHYNTSDWTHAIAFQLMGAGALALCATQGVLAWQLARHGRAGLHPVLKQAVVLGLWLTLALGAGAGAMLGSMQPPAGVGLPVFGWHASGDLRPAHFLGMHAQQLLPLAGLLLMRLPQTQGLRALRILAVVYGLVWLTLVLMGLNGAVLSPPPLPLR